MLVDSLSFREEKRLIDAILMLVDSRMSIHMFSRLYKLLSDKGYWYALGKAYTGGDWPDNYTNDEKRWFFGSHRPFREYLMTSAERRYFDSLPQKVTIYRAMTILEQESGDFGLSWTMSKKVAEFFAYKYQRYARYQDHEKVIHALDVDKKTIIAYFACRKEHEVIYDHSEGDLLF